MSSSSSVSSLSESEYSSAELPKEAEDSCLEKIKIIFEKIVDCLILIGYAIQLALRKVESWAPFKSKRLFQDRILGTTSNSAKFSDLPKYVAFRHAPITITEEEQQRARSQGFILEQETLVPHPISKGDCFGNTTIFLKKWLKGKSIDQIVEKFRGGSPIGGVICQQKYENHAAISYPPLEERIKEVIDRYPDVSFAKEKKLWEKQHLGDAICILEALMAYLEKGNHPENGDFVEKMTSWCRKKKKIRITGQLKATLRDVAEKFTENNLTVQDLHRAAFGNEDLKVVYSSPMGLPRDILESITQLKPGGYELSFPVYNSLGIQLGNHSIGFTIPSKKKGTCYLLDINCAIGYCPFNELQATLGCILTEYNGLDYSEDLDGVPPSFWQWVFNGLILERANPPQSLAPEYAITGVKKNL
jgi:hypothetical protein